MTAGVHGADTRATLVAPTERRGRGIGRPAFFATLLALGSLACMGLLGGRTAFSQSAVSALSPEEAVTALVPFALGARDLPQGYQPGRFDVSTPATMAFFDVPGSGDERAALDARQGAGFVVTVTESLLATAGSSAPSAQFAVTLMTDAASAKAYALGSTFPPQRSATVTIQSADAGQVLGDATSAYHLGITTGGRAPTGSYLIRWSRGQLVFTVTASAAAGQEKLADAVALATAIDIRESTVPAPTFAAPTVPAPATEAQRLDALDKLASAAPGDSDAPVGYQLASASVLSNARLVFGQRSPQSVLQRVDLQWKRVIGLTEIFDTSDSNGPLLQAGLTVDGDAAAAQYHMRDTVTTGSSVALADYDPGIKLGDAMYGFVSNTVNADGTVTQEASILWTHGPVLLNAAMFMDQGNVIYSDLTALAQAMESSYQNSAFVPAPARLPAPGAPSSTTPSSNPTPMPAPAPAPTTSTVPPPATGASVTILNFTYDPDPLIVAAGTTVTWTNSDNVRHSATADDSSFDTGLLANGQSGSLTFATPGTYTYTCTIHPNMAGTLIVQ